MGGFIGFMEDHIWAPVIAGVAIVAIVVVIIWWCVASYRKRREEETYSPLLGKSERTPRSPPTVAERMTLEKIKVDSTQAAAAGMSAHMFLRGTKYRLLQQLPDIGSRQTKAFFVVRSGTEDLLMSLIPRSDRCRIPFSKSGAKALKSICLLLQHPFVLPVRDLDLLSNERANNAVIFHPLSVKGSVKDMIYHSNPISSWQRKYSKHGRPLPPRTIAQFGREIIEGVQFLEERRDIPLGCHLHTGNIVISADGHCQVTGYENTLLGYRSRIEGMLRGLLRNNPGSATVICFGHAIYEMALGYELETSRPDVDQLIGRCPYELIEVLAFIFFNEQERFPTLAEVKEHKFFKKTTVPQLDTWQPPPIQFSSSMREVLRAVKEDRPVRTKSRRQSSGMSINASMTSPINSPDSSRPSSPALSYATTSFAGSPPPPPPPAAAPMPVAASTPAPSGGGERGALLSQIHRGASLKRTETNDRSRPVF